MYPGSVYDYVLESRVNKWSWGVLHLYNILYIIYVQKVFPRSSQFSISQPSSSFFKLTHNTHTTPTALINIPHVRQRHHGTLAALIDRPHQC
jgi:hypothetical protein